MPVISAPMNRWFCPWSRGERARVATWDWGQRSFGGVVEIDPEASVVIEGCGALSILTAPVRHLSVLDRGRHRGEKAPGSRAGWRAVRSPLDEVGATGRPLLLHAPLLGARGLGGSHLTPAQLVELGVVDAVEMSNLVDEGDVDFLV
jgi:hypothetical protein